MLNKLRAKFILIIMIISVTMIGALVALLGVNASRSIGRESLGHLSGRSIIFNMATTMNPALQEMYSRVYPSYFALSSAEDAPVFSYGEVTVDLNDSAVRADIYNSAANSSKNDGILGKYRLRFLKRELSGYIIFSDAADELSARTHVWLNSILLGLASILILFVISLLVSKAAIRPAMDALSQQKQFIADVSHELKTPVTVMLTNAELLSSDGADRASQKQYSDNILVTAKQMRTLVEQLLELARIDSSGAALNLEPLDLSVLVSDTMLPFDPVFYENGRSLSSDIEPGVVVKGSAEHLAQVLDILLDNALKYADPGTEVTVRLKSASRSCLLSVESRGAEIGPEERKNIFKRFYTADKARTSGSYGLGLAIADGIVEMHHGKIWAESEGGLNTFIVQLPL